MGTLIKRINLFFKSVVIEIVPKQVEYYYEQKAVNAYKQSLNYSSLSYSQEGEDLILNRYFEDKENGFYIDIGAHHPRRFSNTHFFYKKGWSGINIDAMPGSMDLFTVERLRDINLEIGVSKEKGELMYHMFNEPALNTFSQLEAQKKDGFRNYKIIEKRKVFTFPIKEILEKHLKINQIIDFMSIDVEGLDLEVLESNDWNKFRPSLVLVEELQMYTLAELPFKSDLYKVLINNQYELVAKTLNTLFFKDNKI